MRVALVFVLAVTGCTPLAVTEYNGDSLRIQSDTSTVSAAAFEEAQRICATRGLKAEYASTWSSPVDIFHHSHLFLCLSQTKPNSGMPPGSMRRVTYLETSTTL